MNLVKHETLETGSHELQFSIDAQTFNDAVNKAFKRESKKYNIPGFRKGKAPRHMIEKMFGEDVFYYDAINDLFPEEYEAAVAESGIDPVDRPQVDVVSVSIQDGVVLKAVVTVKPEMKIGVYKGLKATRKVNTVTDSEVDAEIDRMRERNARIIPKEGKAENGDITDIDFEGFVNGEAFEGGKAEHFSLTLGSGQFIPGFEDQIIGHEAGESFDVNVTFPEQYQAEELAGKPAVFKVTLHEVKEKDIPAADDEFAKDVSEYDTLDEFKASIRKEKEDRCEQEADVELENDLVNQIVATMEGDIPPVMIDTRAQEMLRDFEYRLQQQGLNLQTYLQYIGDTPENFQNTTKQRAEEQVKIRLALEAVVRAESISVSDEEFEAEVKRIADNYKMAEDKVRGMVPEKEVRGDLAVNKAIDFVKKNAEITTEQVDRTQEDNAEKESAE